MSYYSSSTSVVKLELVFYLLLDDLNLWLSYFPWDMELIEKKRNGGNVARSSCRRVGSGGRGRGRGREIAEKKSMEFLKKRERKEKKRGGGRKGKGRGGGGGERRKGRKSRFDWLINWLFSFYVTQKFLFVQEREVIDDWGRNQVQGSFSLACQWWFKSFFLWFPSDFLRFHRLLHTVEDSLTQFSVHQKRT